MRRNDGGNAYSLSDLFLAASLDRGGPLAYRSPMRRIEGHAIVSADGMIADAAGVFPLALRNDTDWRQYQAALDAAALTILGRVGHERFPNPGRRRLVATRRVAGLAPDPRDPLAALWNPAGMPLEEALAQLGFEDRGIAVAGVFDLLLPHITHFQLSESHGLTLPGGTPCFARGHPRVILAANGLVPGTMTKLDEAAGVTTTLWSRAPAKA